MARLVDPTVDTTSIGWEKAVLGTVLANPALMEETEVLRTSDFTGCHQELWGEMLTLQRRGSLEVRSLVESLRARSRLNVIASFDTGSSGEAYLRELVGFRGDALPEYVERVLNASIKRQLRLASALIRADADDENVTAEEALDGAERRMLELRRTRLANQGTSMADLVQVFSTRVDEMRAGTYEPAWTPNIQAWRDVIQFMETEDYMVVAARPGEGKSSLALHEALAMANGGAPDAPNAANRKPVTIFNLENGEIEYARKGVAWLTGIDSMRLRDPRRLSEAEMAQVRSALTQLSRMPIHVVTLGAPSALEIERIARQHISRFDVKLIVVDYIQLVKNGLDNRNLDVTETSGTLRSIPLRYGVPLLANSQLSRNIVHRGDNAEPELSDLRESGSLEQDATIVTMPRLLWSSPTEQQLRMYPQNVDPLTNRLHPVVKAIPVQLFVKKHRNGGVGVTEPILWVKSTGRFLTLTRPQ